MEPDLAQFDGSWTAHLDTMGSEACLDITELDCDISNGAVSCLGGVVQGTVDSSGSVDGGMMDLSGGRAGDFIGTICTDGGTLSYPRCEGMWMLTQE